MNLCEYIHIFFVKRIFWGSSILTKFLVKIFQEIFVVFNLVIKNVERVSLLLKTLFILKIQKIPARYLGHCNIKKRSGFISEATSKDTFVWKEWLARIFEKLYFGGRSYDCPKQEDIHNLLMCFRKLDLWKH